MAIRIAVCDDSKKDIQNISKMIEHYNIKHNYDFVMTPFTDGASLLDSHKESAFQIIFLDIEMPKLNGIEIAKCIRKIDFDTYIIFTTSYPKYMRDSFEVQPFQFLDKPIISQDVDNVLDQILIRLYNSTRYFMFDSVDGRSYPVLITDIMYISTSSKKNILEIHTVSDVILISGTLQTYEKKFTDYHFVLCYRGILVNTQYIHVIHTPEILLFNGEKIPLSRRKESMVKAAYIDYMITE